MMRAFGSDTMVRSTHRARSEGWRVVTVTDGGGSSGRFRGEWVLAGHSLANLMTEPRETDSFTLADQVAALVAHAGPGAVDGVRINRRPFPERALARYRAAGAVPTRMDFDRVAQWGVREKGP